MGNRLVPKNKTLLQDCKGITSPRSYLRAISSNSHDALYRVALTRVTDGFNIPNPFLLSLPSTQIAVNLTRLFTA